MGHGTNYSINTTNFRSMLFGRPRKVFATYKKQGDTIGM